jgi:hypothetical protein
MYFNINDFRDYIRRKRYDKYLQWAKIIKQKNCITWRVFIIDVLHLPFSARKKRLLEGAFICFDNETLELFNALEDIYYKDINYESKDEPELYEHLPTSIMKDRPYK